MIEGRRVVAGEAILDGAIIERSRIGSSDALLEKLVREHSGLVYRIAYSVLRLHEDAEDATQETFMRVLRYSLKLSQVEDPKTWLARIAWRVAIDRSKRRGRTREIALEDADRPLPEATSSESSASDRVQGNEINAVLEKMIAAIPSKLRDPLVLSTIDGMSPREVAEILGINEAAVRSRVFRARQIVKEKLAQRGILT
ncbi:MAG TPA: RNA polymerase sigma factor [Candidatus Sulfotelmatobacter sp.]|nr:RNA polymerase sigma factor [Candidatus Sulfotelmatobacter sp.]